MTQQELKNCIFILNDMEQNIYMMTRMCEKFDEEIKKTEKCEYPELKKPEEPKYYKVNLLSEMFIYNPISEFLLEHMFDEFECSDIYDFLLSSIRFIFYAVLGIVLLPISIIVGAVIYLTDKPKTESHNQKLRQEYEDACKKYENDCTEREVQRYKELKKIDEMKKQKQGLLVQRKESQAKLDEFYEKININEKFRGILPMSYMAEFIKLGIATKLEGADGLYYLVLKELKDTEFKYSITAKLDEAVQKEQSLHKELERMKRTCDIMMLNSANNASSNTIDSYQSERIARELEYQTYLIKKGIYG